MYDPLHELALKGLQQEKLKRAEHNRLVAYAKGAKPRVRDRLCFRGGTMLVSMGIWILERQSLAMRPGPEANRSGC